MEELLYYVGKVRDVRLIKCKKKRRLKGIEYVELRAKEYVKLELGMEGKKLIGVKIIVKNKKDEKNSEGN
jgi:hypothetical protein